jgi:hypothetical protein
MPGGGANLSLWHFQSPVQNYLTFNGSTGDIYLAQSGGNIGINTTNPTSPLHVLDQTASTTALVYSQVNATGNIHARAFYGSAIPASGYGYGGIFYGGYIGTYAYASGGSSTGTVYGSYNYAYGTAGNRYGVYGTGSGTGSGTRVGVYGYAYGGTYNYALYASGNIYYTGALLTPIYKSGAASVSSAALSESTLSKLMKLNIVEYSNVNAPQSLSSTSSPAVSYSLTEDDMMTNFPELVVDAVQLVNSEPEKESTEPPAAIKAVKYNEMIPLLIKAIQEQQQMIESQQQTITQLKSELTQLSR